MSRPADDPPPFTPQFLDDLRFVRAALSGGGLARRLERLSTWFDDWRERELREVRAHLDDLPPHDPLLCPISLFGTMDLGRLERAHSRTLAWLLDPRHAHGFGSELLRELLQLARPDVDFSALAVRETFAEYPIEISNFGSGYFDIWSRGTWRVGEREEPWLLVVEAKVDAAEGVQQLEKYDAWLAAHAPSHGAPATSQAAPAGATTIIRVFLTPGGHASQADSPHWLPISFADLVRVFRRPLMRAVGSDGFHFLRFYLAGILRDVCNWPLPITADVRDPYHLRQYLREAGN